MIIKFKKIFCIILILILFNSMFYAVFADEEDEDIGLEEHEIEEILITSAEAGKEPTLYSRTAVIYDRESGKVIYGKDENTPRPMASTTKIMTAIILLENGDLEQTVKVDKKAAQIGGSRLGLGTNDEITMNDLFYGLMLCSGNDAAIQIAISIAGSVEEFAEMMNEKAKSLGLKDTHFVSPHGLDNDEHYTTAYELAVITDYALNIEKFKEVVCKKTHTVTINGYPKTIRNTNELLGYIDGVNGVKTGFTNKARKMSCDLHNKRRA